MPDNKGDVVSKTIRRQVEEILAEQDFVRGSNGYYPSFRVWVLRIAAVCLKLVLLLSPAVVLLIVAVIAFNLSISYSWLGKVAVGFVAFTYVWVVYLVIRYAIIPRD